MFRIPARAWILWLVAAACLSAPLRATPVDIAHPVYAFLRRLEIEGWVAPGHLNALPIPKTEVGELLEQAQARADSLFPWERRRLQSFREEFGLAENRDGRFRPLDYSDSSFRVRLRAESFNGGYVSDSVPVAGTFGFGYLIAGLEGSYREKIQFQSLAGIGQELSLHARFTETYDPQRGMPYNTDRTGKAGIPRTASSMDAFRTLIGYEEKGLRVEMGTDWNQWGPGIWQHPFLSRQPWFWVQDSLPPSDSAGFRGTPNPGRYRRGYRYPGESAPMTQLRMAFRLGRFTYTKMVAQRTGLWKDSLAYVVAHRVEFRPWDRLGLGLQEMVATAGRPLDWTYAFPLIPLKYAEHQLGDRDNIAIGLDAEILLARRFRAFGELFLDDFSGWDFGFWGAKHAYLLGGEAVALPFHSSRIQLEWARVEPWVFTHTRVNGQLQHFGSLLGSGIPANSQAVRAAWEHAVRDDLDLRIEYAFMQRDAKSRGGSVFDWHENAIDGTQKEFLGGIVETRHAARLEGTYRWRRFVEFRGSLGYLSVEDWKSRSGESLATPTLAGELTLRY